MAPDAPLHGQRIAITRAEDQAPALAQRLRALGAEVLSCPSIAIAPPADYTPLDAALARLPDYHWLILTSANGVRALLGRLAGINHLKSLKIAAIGPATAAELEHHGLHASFVPSAYVAEAIVEEIGDVAGQRILLPRADIARPALAVGLRARGAVVDEVAAYRTLPGDGADRLVHLLRGGGLDVITFTSSSTVRYLLDGLEAVGLDRAEARHLLAGTAVACIGPITAATARQEGLPVAAVAQEYTADGLVAAIVHWLAQSARPARGEAP